jgi:hypothetical protein
MLSGTAAGLLSCGAIGEDYGRRRTFLAGALVLVLVRVLQGIGSAGLRLRPVRRALSIAQHATLFVQQRQTLLLLAQDLQAFVPCSFRPAGAAPHAQHDV